MRRSTKPAEWPSARPPYPLAADVENESAPFVSQTKPLLEGIFIPEIRYRATPLLPQSALPLQAAHARRQSAGSLLCSRLVLLCSWAGRTGRCGCTSHRLQIKTRPGGPDRAVTALT